MDSGPVATFQVHEHLRPKVMHSSKNYFMGWITFTLCMNEKLERREVKWMVLNNFVLLPN